jgi:hypothetical protein
VVRRAKKHRLTYYMLTGQASKWVKKKKTIAFSGYEWLDDLDINSI